MNLTLFIAMLSCAHAMRNSDGGPNAEVRWDLTTTNEWRDITQAPVVGQMLSEVMDELPEFLPDIIRQQIAQDAAPRVQQYWKIQSIKDTGEIMQVNEHYLYRSGMCCFQNIPCNGNVVDAAMFVAELARNNKALPWFIILDPETPGGEHTLEIEPISDDDHLYRKKATAKLLTEEYHYANERARSYRLTDYVEPIEAEFKQYSDLLAELVEQLESMKRDIFTPKYDFSQPTEEQRKLMLPIQAAIRSIDKYGSKRYAFSISELEIVLGKLNSASLEDTAEALKTLA